MHCTIGTAPREVAFQGKMATGRLLQPAATVMLTVFRMHTLMGMGKNKILIIVRKTPLTPPQSGTMLLTVPFVKCSTKRRVFARLSLYPRLWESRNLRKAMRNRIARFSQQRAVGPVLRQFAFQ